MSGVCPTCGQPLAAPAVPVSFDLGDVVIDGHRRHMRPMVAETLRALARRSPRMVAKESLYEVLYGMCLEPPLPKIIDVNVCQARQALRGTVWTIQTVWGRGVRLIREGDK